MSVSDVVSYNCFIKDKVDMPTETNVRCSRNSDISPKETASQVRTRKELSLKEKLEILKLYDKLPKMSQRSAAIKLKISQPVLCKILKNRNFIENIMLTNENSVRKRTRGGKEREIESALKLWYVEVHKKNIPINGQIIREKAKELAKQMGKEFAATDGWFTRWRKRENIVYNSLFRRNLKPAKELDCFLNQAKGIKDCKSVLGSIKEFIDENKNDCKESRHCSDSLSCQTSSKLSSEYKVPVTEDSKNWKLKSENICEVFIKSEPVPEEEYEFEEKPYVQPPSDEEMLEALRILNAGVKHRTNDLQLQYEYENYIYQLLKKSCLSLEQNHQ